jgi:hypothetical protein
MTDQEELYSDYNSNKISGTNYISLGDSTLMKSLSVLGQTSYNQVYSKNKFDKSICYDGYIDYTTGIFNKVSADNNKSSDFISVKQSTNYTISGHAFVQLIDANVGLAWYSSNDESTFISGTSFNKITGCNTYMSPVNASYIRYTINSSDIDMSQFEEGNSATYYVPFVPGSMSLVYPFTINQDVSTINICGKNLLVNDQSINSFSTNNAGAVITSKTIYDNFNNSANSIDIELANGTAASVELCLMCQPIYVYGKTHTISMWIRSPKECDTDNVYFNVSYGDRYIASVKLFNDSNNTEWNRLSLSFVPKATDSDKRIKIFYTETCSALEIQVAKVQCELSNCYSDYEQYYGESLTLPYPSYSLLSGIRDTYNVVSDTFIKNIGKLIVDGNSTIVFYAEYTDRYGSKYVKVGVNVTNIKTGTGEDIICSMFPASSSIGNGYCGSWDDNYIDFGLSESLVNITSSDTTDNAKITKIKAWLSSNNITVLYPLSTSVITDSNNDRHSITATNITCNNSNILIAEPYDSILQNITSNLYEYSVISVPYKASVANGTTITVTIPNYISGKIYPLIINSAITAASSMSINNGASYSIVDKVGAAVMSLAANSTVLIYQATNTSSFQIV